MHCYAIYRYQIFDISSLLPRKNKHTLYAIFVRAVVRVRVPVPKPVTLRAPCKWVISLFLISLSLRPKTETKRLNFGLSPELRLTNHRSARNVIADVIADISVFFLFIYE